MIRAGLILLLLVFQAKPGKSETYRVITGEHAEFTRVVVLSETLPDWKFGRTASGYQLRLSDANARFDLERFFELIPRDRINSVQTDPDGFLMLGVSCECHADAFEIPQGLVLDIRNGKPPTKSEFEQVLAVPETQSNHFEFSGHLLVPELGQRVMAQRTSRAWSDRIAIDTTTGTAPEGSSASDAVAMSPIMAIPETGAAKTQPDQRPRELDTVTLNATLMNQVSRAITQGLLTPDLSQIEDRLDAVTPRLPDEDDPPAPGTYINTSDTEPAQSDGRQLRFETAADRAFADLAEDTEYSAGGDICVGDETLDIASWGDERTMQSGAFATRIGFVDEFDVVNMDAFVTKAKSYLYLTFGAEVRAMFGAFDVNAPNQSLLLSIADIMDTGRSENPVLGQDQMACSGHAAFWAILSQAKIIDKNLVNKNAVLATFGTLPIHLRRHLGPPLAARFLVAGDIHTSDRIRDLITRPGGGVPESSAMLGADLSLAEGQQNTATTQLESIFMQDGSLAPEALTKLIEAQIDAGQPVDPKHVESAVAMGVETRGTEAGFDLARAALRGMLHLGDYERAIAAITDAAAREQVRRDEIAQLYSEFYAVIVERADDARYLRLLAKQQPTLEDTDNDRALRLRLAKRLLQLNVPMMARQMINDAVTLPNGNERQLIAESFVLENKPDLAIGYLIGLDNAGATMLRARALEQAGNFDAAAMEFDRLGDTEGRAALKWRSGAWSELATLPDTPRANAASLAVQTLSPIPTTTLQAGTALLEQSAETRQVLEAMLDDIPSP